jgi:hypothetical protein
VTVEHIVSIGYFIDQYLDEATREAVVEFTTFESRVKQTEAGYQEKLASGEWAVRCKDGRRLPARLDIRGSESDPDGAA